MACLEKGGATIAVFFLPHHQQQPDRREVIGRQGRGECQPRLDHGGTAPFHIGAPQPADYAPFVPRAESLEVPGMNSIHMTDQVELRFHCSPWSPQVVPVFFHLLAFHVETGAGEKILQIKLNVLFLAGRGVDINEIEKCLPQSIVVDRTPDFLEAAWSWFFTAFSSPFLSG